MIENNDIRHGRHCVFMMHVHLVFVTKYRRGVFTKEILDDLRPMFASVCADFKAELVEFDGEDDHVHLLVNYPPKVAISKLVNSLKGVSSFLIRKKNYSSINWTLAIFNPNTLISVRPEEARSAVSKGGDQSCCRPCFETPRFARLLSMRSIHPAPITASALHPYARPAAAHGRAAWKARS